MAKVRVYYNLHKKMWSVQKMTAKGWRVDHHASWVYLENVTPKVSQAGRQRVITERRKNVHAYLIGDLVASAENHWDDAPGIDRRTVQGDSVEWYGAGWRPVTYNPYKQDNFHYDGVPFSSLELVFCCSDRNVQGRETA